MIHINFNEMINFNVMENLSWIQDVLFLSKPVTRLQTDPHVILKSRCQSWNIKAILNKNVFNLCP